MKKKIIKMTKKDKRKHLFCTKSKPLNLLKFFFKKFKIQPNAFRIGSDRFFYNYICNEYYRDTLLISHIPNKRQTSPIDEIN